MAINAFHAIAPTQLIATGTTTALLAVGTVVRIANVSGQRIRITFGGSTVATATPTGAAQTTSGGLGMANAAVEYLGINPTRDTYIAIAADASSGNVEVTVGEIQ